MANREEHNSVGHRIRTLRKSRKLSLRALAKLSGMSANAISMIERGENSPTVSSLRQLAAALEVPMLAFFQDPSEQMLAFVKADQRPRSNMKGMVIEGLATGITEQRIEPFLVTMESGAGATSETYSHDGEEFVFCVEGVMEYRIGNRIYEIRPGDALLFKASQVHSFQNSSATSAVALIIIQESKLQNADDRITIHQSLH